MERGELEKRGNLVTCNDLKVPFSSTKPDDTQRHIKQARKGWKEKE